MTILLPCLCWSVQTVSFCRPSSVACTEGPSASQNKPLKAPTLSKQLVRKHALNNTIIIAFANANHIDYTFNWLTYVFANNITNYLVGAVDPTTARTLSKAGVNFFSMYNNARNGAVGMPEGNFVLSDLTLRHSLTHVHCASSSLSDNCLFGKSCSLADMQNDME